jgi:peptidoglycan hydrolase CwlO-like protein
MKNSTASVLIILNIITLSLLIFLMIEKADNNHSHDTTHVHDTTHSHDYDYAESYHSHNAKEVKFGIFQGDVESRIEELENKIKNLEGKIKKLQNDILFMVLELSR